ncbi:hypothetical protein K504DRAFT_460132 [Pleomassaria siparia CBS 279.74]|uniref:CHY-type domain-containing protein n=1 Tax=Pleomassaria siparia CBS 279.74 TaxID=1314801 RepID=A0A6G1K0W3_9PLEO|nr:hypothetical protein K504DRAFT_460132 [Pleomassaria siparia CBS 279.74]
MESKCHPNESPTPTPPHQSSSLEPTIHGIDLTPLTQCTHWNSPLDIIAIRHACCRKFYACISCHNTLETGHNPSVWSRKDWDDKAVFCGNCKMMWSIRGYVEGGGGGKDGKPKCGGCGAGWNPGCKNHWGLYFDMSGHGKDGL